MKTFSAARWRNHSNQRNQCGRCTILQKMNFIKVLHFPLWKKKQNDRNSTLQFLAIFEFLLKFLELAVCGLERVKIYMPDFRYIQLAKFGILIYWKTCRVKVRSRKNL